MDNATPMESAQYVRECFTPNSVFKRVKSGVHDQS